MNVDESEYIGKPMDDVPTQDPAEQSCMGKKKQKRDGEVVRDSDGNALFGGYCRAWPGKGTDHVGEGRCSLHAGSSSTGKDNPAFKHGLFSDHLGPEDRQTISALEEMNDDEKLDEIINWRLAKLRRYLREMSDEEEMSFWDAFRDLIDAAGTIEDSEIRELAKMLDKNNRAVQAEIDLVRKLIKDRNKIAEGEDVNLGWRQMLAGGDEE